MEVSPPPGSQAVEDLQQEINAQSLEKVQQYYRKLRYLCGPHAGARILDTGGGLCVEGTREPPVPGRAKCCFLSTYWVSVPLPTRAPQILTVVTFLTRFTDEGN